MALFLQRESSEEEQGYIVEAILSKRVRAKGVQYKVRWAGYSSSEDQWVDAADAHCPDLITAFERKQSGAAVLSQSDAETERSADEASGSEYEVDFIISKRTSPGGSVEYQVRWKGYNEEDDTWEASEGLKGCEAAVAQFEEKELRQSQLVEAIQANNAQEAKALVAAGADPLHSSMFTVDGVSYSGTPIHFACLAPSYDCLKIMLTPGSIEVNCFNADGFAPLHVLVDSAANVNERVRAIELLVQHHADVNIASASNHFSPLHMAVNCDVATSRALLERGAHVDARNARGSTPLVYAAACFVERLDIIELLLHQNADVNARNRQGMTALHFAALVGHRNIVRVLLQHGASPFIVAELPRPWATGDASTSKRVLPVDVAMTRGNVLCAQALFRAMRSYTCAALLHATACGPTFSVPEESALDSTHTAALSNGRARGRGRGRSRGRKRKGRDGGDDAPRQLPSVGLSDRAVKLLEVMSRVGLGSDFVCRAAMQML